MKYIRNIKLYKNWINEFPTDISNIIKDNINDIYKLKIQEKKRKCKKKDNCEIIDKCKKIMITLTSFDNEFEEMYELISRL